MDASIQRAFAEVRRRAKSNHPWQRGQPFPQSYFSYAADRGEWVAVAAPTDANKTTITTTTTTATTSSSAISPLSSNTPRQISIFSWNVDFMAPHGRERMAAALTHLQTLQQQQQQRHRQSGSHERPSVIMLQEMLVDDLELIRAQPWIQSSYNMTDLDDRFWESGYYGTVTLVPKTLDIVSVFRVHYEATAMERDALFVDIRVPGDDGGGGGGVGVGSGMGGAENNIKVVRICNTHLESLIAEPPLRPKQMAMAAKWMHGNPDWDRNVDVHASILGGDLNAIQPFDKVLHSDNDLHDAYLATDGVEDAEKGMTWGHMALPQLKRRFGLSRMDKLYFCGRARILDFTTFGMGVEVADRVAAQNLRDIGFEGGWVTDHLGVHGDFEILSSPDHLSSTL